MTSFLVSNVSESLRSLTKNKRCEGMAQVAHQKWAICSGCSQKMSNHERIAQVAHFFTKNERFAQKTDERIPSPDVLVQ